MNQADGKKHEIKEGGKEGPGEAKPKKVAPVVKAGKGEIKGERITSKKDR